MMLFGLIQLTPRFGYFAQVIQTGCEAETAGSQLLPNGERFARIVIGFVKIAASSGDAAQAVEIVGDKQTLCPQFPGFLQRLLIILFGIL